MTTRRSFFKSIAGLFAGAALAPYDFIGGVYAEREQLPAPMVTSFPLQTQMAILTQYMHGELVRLLPGFPEVEDRDGLISADHPYHFGIDMALTPKEIDGLTEEQIRVRHVLPAMTLVANEVRSQKATRFGRLPLPYAVDHVARVTGKGISLRGLRQYNIYSDLDLDRDQPQYFTRFDVLFG